MPVRAGALRAGEGILAAGRLLTRADRILILAVLAAAALALVYQAGGTRPGAVAVVQIDGRTVGRHSLDRADTVTVVGRLGPSRLVVGPEGARILQAPCAGQVCVRRGWVRQGGDVVVCLPNRVVVRISGPARANGLDAVLP
ncbi:MAG: NusG domain II-containing protein [Candidatus Latescibacterota bacterium]